ncbi:MAG: OmpA family protein [Bacteroidetes bacterium]|jgi:outer membrane protein OmpA-like peptidoglycan-associated protein/tetratricopeptide (TPR) repeat protein|nr:OmpA family protein [Bacteroidota bacterium]
MKRIVLIIIVLISVNSVAQDNLRAAKLHFKKMEYAKAAEQFESQVTKNGETQELLQYIGDSYYNNSQFQNSEVWFGKLITNFHSTVDSEYLYKYSQSLKAVNKLDEAKKYMKEFIDKNPNDFRSVKYLADYNSLQEHLKTPIKYTLTNSSLSSNYSEFGTTFYNNGIVYTAPKKGIDVQLYQRNNQPFLDLYKVSINDDNGLAKDSSPLSSNLNNKFHDGAATFSKDGKTMFFTRNNSNKRKVIVDKEGISNLKIFRAQLVNNEWTNITEVPFNNESYSVGQPALSADGKQLYFVSDMPGGFGLTDIYVVDINGDSYGQPKNLGNTINTPGKEMFPYLVDDELFFSSDGHLGFGALDVFSVNLKAADSKVKNLGIPINSGADDFAFIYDTNRKLGFLSSNRIGGLGDDDIYLVNEVPCYQNIIVTVSDQETDKVLTGAKVKLINYTTGKEEVATTGADGVVKFENTNCEMRYNIMSVKENYKSNERNFLTTKELAKDNFVDVKLIPIEQIVTIENIYFDFDKSNIRPDAQVGLNKLIDLMKANPEMVVEIKSFADSRGTVAYNEKLSERRQKSTVAYVISKGIDKSRINGKGYGESMLVNECVDSANCTEEEHQLNRRSEIVILKK